MEPNYLILLNFCVGEVVKIKLTEEEKRKSEEYEDFEEFIKEHIEEKYEIRLKDCTWMTLETLSERTYNFEEGGENA
jgi:hypothetical protein